MNARRAPRHARQHVFVIAAIEQHVPIAFGQLIVVAAIFENGAVRGFIKFHHFNFRNQVVNRDD